MSTINELSEMNEQIESDIALLSDRYRHDKIKKDFDAWKKRFVKHATEGLDPKMLSLPVDQFLDLPVDEQARIKLALKEKGPADKTPTVSNSEFKKMSLAEKDKFLKGGGEIVSDVKEGAAASGEKMNQSQFRKLTNSAKKDFLDKNGEVVPDGTPVSSDAGREREGIRYFAV